MKAYLVKLGKTRIPLSMWPAIKEQWSEFTNYFVNGNVHFIVCGRAQGKWEFVLNEDTGKQELTETDTRMGGENGCLWRG